MSRIGRKRGLTVALVLAVPVVVFAAAALAPVRASDPDWLLGAELLSRDLLLTGLLPIASMLAPVDEARAGPITPLDGPGYFYEDLEHPYLARVREDPRVAHLFGDRPLDVEQAAAMANDLRSRFTRGRSRRDPHRDNVLELLDRAEEGEEFLCGTIAKMLIQLFQAGGGHGRRVHLGGHVVAEIWSSAWQKWVLIDPDTNVYYRNRAGVPLSVYEVHELALREERASVVPIPGTSRNTYYDEEYLDYQLREWYPAGFAVDFHAKWLTVDLPDWHPGRHPKFTSVYTAGGGERPLHMLYIHREVSNPGDLYAPPPDHSR